MNIYLVCNAGMSTSILVRKMQEAAKKEGVDAHIEAFSVEVLDQHVDKADCVLLGPQIRHMLADVKKVIGGKCPVDVIPMQDYGMIRGDKVLKRALKMIKESQE